MADFDSKPLRDSLLCCCTGYSADEAIRATGAALATLVIGCTRDGAAAHDALERLVWVMKDHIEEVARPADSHDSRGEPRAPPRK
jgi:hypothetical protein